jgi:hypothetical protein
MRRRCQVEEEAAIARARGVEVGKIGRGRA